MDNIKKLYLVRGIPILSNVFIISVLSLLGIYNQPYYPVTWIDEGFVLQGAINLVQYGKYAMRSVEGFRLFDQPLVANGPGVVLPIALIYSFGGIDLYIARLVIVFFTIVTGLVIFKIARQWFGYASAFISFFIILALPAEGFLLYGRHTLGMIPSLAYFLSGYLLWIQSLKKSKDRFAILGGILFGLAAVTKGQYLLFFPIIVFTYIIDRFYYKKLSLINFTMTIFPALFIVIGWFGTQLLVMGLPKFLENLAAIRSSSEVTISAFRVSRIPGNILYLIRSGILLVVLPGWIYTIWISRSKVMESVEKLLFIVFIPVWLFWFAIASVGFHRYAFDPFIIGAIFFGNFAVDSFIRTISILREKGRPNLLLHFSASVVVILPMILGSRSLINQVIQIFSDPVKAPQRIAEYIKLNVDPNAIIESWEWEIDALTINQTYHHPTNKMVDEATRKLQFGENVSLEYDPGLYPPEYILDGQFSKWTGIYTGYLNTDCCELIYRAGPYDLYKVIKR